MPIDDEKKGNKFTLQSIFVVQNKVNTSWEYYLLRLSVKI